MSRQLRVGVVGLGAIGYEHVAQFRNHPEAEVVALCDISAERLAKAANELKVERTFQDYRRLIEDGEVDIVSVAVPTCLHAPVTLAALRAGKHVFCEKPAAMDARELTEMIEAARLAGRILMIGQNWRFHKETQKLKAVIASGDLGEIYHLRAWITCQAGIPRLGSWFTRRALAGGGALYDTGVHFLDLVLHLSGNFRPVSVAAQSHNRLGALGIGNGTWGRSEVDATAAFDVEDTAVALVRFANGTSLLFEVAWTMFQEKPMRYGVSLYGTAGGGMLFPARVVTRRPSGVYVQKKPPVPAIILPPSRQVHFCDVVLGRAESYVPLSESLVVQEVLDAIAESARSGREVRLIP